MAFKDIQVRSITIRLTVVETVMLAELQKLNWFYKDFQGLLINQIQQEYQKTPKGKAAK